MSEGVPKSVAPILPQFITLSDSGNYYMTTYNRSNPTSSTKEGLRCIKTEPDADCTFEVIPRALFPGSFALKGNNGKLVSYTVGTTEESVRFECQSDPSGQGAVFQVMRIKGNQVYIHMDLGYRQLFLTSRQHPTHDGVAVALYAGSDCVFTVSEPIVSKEVVSLVYDLPNPVMWDVPPLIALNTTIRNDSKSSDVQQTLGYSYQRSKQGTWNNTAGIELGATMSFSAGVPFIASANFEVSVTGSYSREWGGSEGTEETITSSTQITVPAGKKGKATVLVRRKAMDVKFTYKERITYKTGSTKVIDGKEGVYSNVESYAVDVEAGDWEDA